MTEQTDSNEVGLICAGGDADDVPLTRVSVSCTITNLTANVCTTCTYINKSDHPVEARFVFPLNDVAVYGFEARIGDERVVAQIRPRQEAQITYDEALASGHTTFMAEQDETCEDVFNMRIGNIPVDTTVFIVLKYIGHIGVETVEIDKKQHSRAIFTLPGALNPRYKPDYNEGKEGYENGSLSGGICPYQIKFAASILMPLKIINITSREDVFNVEWTSFDHRKAKASLASQFQADHDLQMEVLMEGVLSSFAVSESGSKQEQNILSMGCIMAQFLPDFSKLNKAVDSKSEVTIIVDRSNKMLGENIRFAAECLMLFIKGLPKGCRFQIISYGDMHTTLFPEPVTYDVINSTKASEFQRSLKADMGGTELLPALNTAFSSALPSEEWCKKIIILSSGALTNADALIGAVRDNVSQARVFVVGIGDGSSSYILSSIARAGQGIAVSVRANNQLRSAAKRVLQAALQPRATNIQVTWDVHADNIYGEAIPITVNQVPEVQPPIFKDCFTTVFGLFDQQAIDKRRVLKGQIRLECDVGGQKQTITTDVPDFKERRLLSSTVDFPLHRLAGKYQLDDMCDQQRMLLVAGEGGHADPEEDQQVADLRSRIEQLSCAINVLSPRTAFVAVDPVIHKPIKFAPPPPVPIFNLRSAPMVMAASIPQSTDLLQFSSDPEAVTESKSKREPLNDNWSNMDIVEEQKDVLTKLIELQTPDGSWILDDSIAQCLGLTLDELKNTLPKSWNPDIDAPVSEEVWATFLVLAYLESVLKHRSDEWDLLADKSYQWIDEQAREAYPEVTDLETFRLDCFYEAAMVVNSKTTLDEQTDQFPY